MNIGFLITVRLKSTRLKRKVLLPLNGMTALDRVIQRARLVPNIKDIVVCTSTVHQDLPLVDEAIRNGVYYFNGHPEDVLSRLLTAAKLFGMDYFVGITADNPLFCHYHAGLISQYVMNHPDVDFVSSTGMPIGLNTYAISVKALEVVCTVKKVIDTEIWGPLINRPELFNVHTLKAEESYDRLCRLTMDEPDDYRLFQEIYNSFDTDHAPTIPEVYELFDKRPELIDINAHVVQQQLDANKLEMIDSYYREHLDHVLETKRAIYGRTG